MTMDNSRGAMFRPIAPDQHSRVTYAELFFDLVFVFAVTQLSHTLLNHFTLSGAVHVTLLFLAVWWVWVYTTWITNWLNPEMTPVRVLLCSCLPSAASCCRPRSRRLSKGAGCGLRSPTPRCRS